MYRNLLLIIGLTLIFVSNAGFAQTTEVTMNDPSDKSSALSEKLSDYIAVGNWQVSLSLGIGKRTSTLTGTKDQTLLLIPTFSFYGERVYFDNGSLGYTLLDTNKYSLSAVTEIHPIAGQYFDLHPANLILGTEEFDNKLDTPSTQGDEDGVRLPPNVTIQDVIKRYELNNTDMVLTKPDWSLDAGFRWNWFIDNNQQFTIEAFTDVTDIHNGNRFEFEWSRTMLNADVSPESASFDSEWQGQLRLGISYYDKKTTQYFFGIDERHNPNPVFYYDTSHSINPHASVFLTRPAFEDWRLVVFLKTVRLANPIYKSPRTEHRFANTFFIGLTYDF